MVPFLYQELNQPSVKKNQMCRIMKDILWILSCFFQHISVFLVKGYFTHNHFRWWSDLDYNVVKEAVLWDIALVCRTPMRCNRMSALKCFCLKQSLLFFLRIAVWAPSGCLALWLDLCCYADGRSAFGSTFSEHIAYYSELPEVYLIVYIVYCCYKKKGDIKE